MMRPLTLAILVGLCLTACGDDHASRSGGPLSDARAQYDVLHYDLAVAVRPDQRMLDGRLTMTAAVEDTLNSVVLDLDRRLSAERAERPEKAGGSLLPLQQDEELNQIRIGLRRTYAPGDTVRVRVAYRGSPRVAPDPPWEGGITWETTPTGAPWIATSVQRSGADLWWPVKDHPCDEPDSMDISITVPDSLVAASNGTLRAAERATDSTQTFHWHVSTSINAYGVTLNVAPYVRIDTTYASVTGENVPAAFYALPTDSSRARTVFPSFLDQLRFLEKTLGPYPFRRDKYGVAQTPFLGMEHQTLIAYGHDFGPGGLGYDASFDALHFHELAHEWYGNCLTVRDWKDIWLHEGPATYLEALYAESRRGEAAYQQVIDHFREQVSNGVPIARKSPAPIKDMYNRDAYYKGALVLHTLRFMMGRDSLTTLLRRFVGHQSAGAQTCRHVDTEEFFSLAESLADRSLNGIAATYLYQASPPDLETIRTRDTLRLAWRNTGGGTFEVPVPVRVGDTTRRVSMAGERGALSVPTEAEVQIDPEGWVLRAE